MHKSWQLQDAKNRFSEVVNDALRDGPQWVTRHGRETVVVLSIEDYGKLAKPKKRLYDVLRHSPLKGVELDLARDKSFSRDVKL